MESDFSRRRLDYLDSLRGIAALIVMMHHLYQTDPVFPELIRLSPLRLLLNGRPAVIFFFVLSGFVLSYGLWRGSLGSSWLTFALRRVARIYLPYLAAGIGALLAMQLVATGPLASVAITFNEMWVSPFDPRTALSHLLLVGSKAANTINVPSWSLVYELRISMIIPLFCYFVERSPRGFLLAFLAVWTLGEGLSMWRGLSGAQYSAENFVDNVLVTLHFSSCFLAGVLLARWYLVRPEDLLQLSQVTKAILICCSLVLLYFIRDLANTLGALALLVLALGSPAFQKFLRTPLLHWLGTISFSLYLTHMIVLEFVVRSVHGWLPTGISVLVSVPLILVVAWLTYRWVERPSQRLSAYLGRPAIRSRTAI